MEQPRGAPVEIDGSRLSAEALERTRTRVSDAPLPRGNSVTLLRNGPEAYDEWLRRIARAERFVHLETWWGPWG